MPSLASVKVISEIRVSPSLGVEVHEKIRLSSGSSVVGVCHVGFSVRLHIVHRDANTSSWVNSTPALASRLPLVGVEGEPLEPRRRCGPGGVLGPPSMLGSEPGWQASLGLA